MALEGYAIIIYLASLGQRKTWYPPESVSMVGHCMNWW